MASYIDQSLTKNEKVIERFSHHWSAWLGFWALVILGPLTIGITWIIAIFVFLGLKGVERAVTTKRIIQKKGVISRKTDEMKLASIETVEIVQGILARIFGSGNIKVTGRGVSDVLLKNVDDPMAVKKAIEEAEDYTEEGTKEGEQSA